MGFLVLSQFAHRLEDSFKVLKIQKHAVEIDGELERLLLAAVDCLGNEIEIDRASLLPGNPVDIDPTQLLARAEPIFDRLSERLGDSQEEDASSVLLPEDGQDVILLLFETEVEGCLERLESVLANPEMPCLEEELGILAQELGGLGEMLQIGAFSRLCNSVTTHLSAQPDRAQEIAQSALAAWRRSQALILTGQFDLLPTDIDRQDAPVPTPVVAEWVEPQPLELDGLETHGVPIPEVAAGVKEPINVEAEPLTTTVEIDVEAEPLTIDSVLVDPVSAEPLAVDPVLVDPVLADPVSVEEEDFATAPILKSLVTPPAEDHFYPDR
jgi:chemotaxis protein histidine kinase CheA